MPEVVATEKTWGRMAVKHVTIDCVMTSTSCRLSLPVLRYWSADLRIRRFGVQHQGQGQCRRQVDRLPGSDNMLNSNYPDHPVDRAYLADLVKKAC